MATAIDKAVEWAVSIANDNTHGYDQTNRWGPDYDCSSFVITAWQQAGVPVKTKGASYTGNMKKYFLSCGFKDVTSQVNFKTGEGLETGDVLLMSKHTEMMINSVQMVGASINENNWITGGQTGDQTEFEIRIRDYYNKPWVTCLRFPGGSSSGSYDWVVYDTDEAGKMTQSDKENNAKIIYSILMIVYGWTREAISGALGSMEIESFLNPGQWEIGRKTNTQDGYGYAYGYGLIQWTRPGSSYPNPYLNYCYENNFDRLDGSEQIKYLNTDMTTSNLWGWISTSAFPESFSDYKNSKKEPEYLASVWFHNLERPASGDTSEQTRKARARFWYDFLDGVDPFLPNGSTEETKKKKGLSLIMMYLATKR